MDARKIACFGALALSCVMTAASGAHAAVVISNKATKNMNCSVGVCTPTAKSAVLNTGDLQTMLAASDVTVNTGANAVSIAISAPVTWASTSRLTLNASNGISIKAAVVVEGTGAMTITPNQSVSGADLNIFPGGSISFWDNASNLIIAGNSYTLVSDLSTLNTDVGTHPDGFYALAKDFDATGISFPADAAVTTTLTGTFEGLGHTVSNFTISAFDDFNIGLFEEVDGTARDLSMTAGNIQCDLDNSGAAAGMFAAVNRGTLKNIAVAGVISCARARVVGGVVGANADTGTVSNVISSVTIPASKAHEAGGVAGENDGTIQNSSASGSIAGNWAGGLVGSTTGTLLNSHATGNVTNSTGDEGGGLAGDAEGLIAGCFATGNVNAKKVTGGLVGHALVLILENSFATGTAQARDAGGLVGLMDAHVQLMDDYARGSATATAPKIGGSGGLAGVFNNAGDSITQVYSLGAPSGGKYSGGSVGQIAVATTMTSVFWDFDTSGVTDPSKGAGSKANYPGIAGLSDAALKSGLPSGFDSRAWGQSPSINNGYPYLLVNPPQ